MSGIAIRTNGSPASRGAAHRATHIAGVTRGSRGIEGVACSITSRGAYVHTEGFARPDKHGVKSGGCVPLLMLEL